MPSYISFEHQGGEKNFNGVVLPGKVFPTGVISPDMKFGKLFIVKCAVNDGSTRIYEHVLSEETSANSFDEALSDFAETLEVDTPDKNISHNMVYSTTFELEDSDIVRFVFKHRQLLQPN